MKKNQINDEQYRIGKKIATINFTKGQNKADLSRLSGVNSLTVDNVVNGSGCRLKSLIQVADAAGLKIELTNKDE